MICWVVNSMALKVLVGTMVLVGLIANWLPGMDAAARAYLDLSMADSLVVYATARGLNAVISVIQSVHLSVSLGAGVGLNLGEMLDPLNDLIERFSTFVLYGLAAIGLQKLLLLASGSLVMKIITSLLMIAGYLAWLFQPARFAWLVRLGLMIALVRFALLIEVGTVAVLDSLYFDDRTQQAESALNLAREELGSLRQRYLASVAESGVFGGVWEAASSVLGDDGQQGVADLAAGAIVELIVIMLVRSVVMPLLFIWALVVLMGRLASIRVPSPGQVSQAGI